ncbi:MAG: hypothetical protein ACRD1S_19590 [Vicinamibacterales bacterium]
MRKTTSFLGRSHWLIWLVGGVWAAVGVMAQETIIPRVPNPPLASDLSNLPGDLRAVAVPGPPSLGDFVKDPQAAIALGKALFWDMQVGSDGVQACASCPGFLEGPFAPGPLMAAARSELTLKRRFADSPRAAPAGRSRRAGAGRGREAVQPAAR